MDAHERLSRLWFRARLVFELELFGPAVVMYLDGPHCWCSHGCYSYPSDCIQPAMACPTSSGQSSCGQRDVCNVTSVCAGQVRQYSRKAPLKMAAGWSQLMNSLGIGLCSSHLAYAS